MAAARAREVEVARLRALQEQAQDKMAERHARDARRQQDELERQVWDRGFGHLWRSRRFL